MIEVCFNHTTVTRSITEVYLSSVNFDKGRSSIVANTDSALTAQSAFLKNFENVVNHRVDIREDLKHYQDTLSYASSKVNYSVGKTFSCYLAIWN